MVNLHRKTFFYRPGPDRNAELARRLRELAAQYPRYGSEMRYHLLRREMKVNHKRVDRIYRREGLSLRLKTRRKRASYLRVALPVPARPDEAWSMDFIHDALSSGRPFKCLTIVDHFSKESPANRVDHSIRGKDVVATLERLRKRGRKPGTIVVDNGPEFRSKALALWATLHGVRLHFIEPGHPVQNAFIESFNSRIRAECLSAQWYRTLEEARLYIEAWRKEYENVRPHSSLGGMTPKEFADRSRVGVTEISAVL